MNLGRPRLEEQHVPPVLEGGYVLVQSLPVVGDDDDPALGDELPRDAVPLEAPGIALPGDGLLLLGLAEALQKPHSGPVCIEGVDVVDDDELITVPI
jgi:hypothetical protein